MHEDMKKLSQGRILLEVDKETYDTGTVLKTSYKCTDGCYMYIDSIFNKKIGAYSRAVVFLALLLFAMSGVGQAQENKIPPKVLEQIVHVHQGTAEEKYDAIIRLRKMGQKATLATDALINVLSDRTQIQVYKSKRKPVSHKSGLSTIRPAGAAWITTTIGQVAAETIAVIDPMGTSVPLLADQLKSNSEVLRENAAIALGEFGPKAKVAIPALIEALKTEEGFAKREASEALRKITSKDFGEDYEGWHTWGAQGAEKTDLPSEK